MPIILPDSTKFDADSDRISTSRPELKKMADAVNTLATEWNNQGDSFGSGGIQEIIAGTNILISNPDSANSVTITNDLVSYTQLRFDEELFGVTAGDPLDPPPTVTLSAAKRHHTIDYGTNSASGVTKYVDVALDAIGEGSTHVFWCFGTLLSNNRVALRLKHNSTILTLSDGTTQYVFDDVGLEHWGCTLTKVDSNKYLVHWNGGVKVFV